MSVIRLIFKSTLINFILVSSLLAAPERIMSLNICTDNMLLLLAKDEQIASLSFLAHRPEESIYYEKAKNFPINRAQIEDILAVEPDLVLLHSYSSPYLFDALEKFSIPYLTMNSPKNFEEILLNWQQFGEAFGQLERAELLIENFNEKIEMINSKKEALASPSLVAAYGPNGYVSGKTSLFNFMIETAGFESLASRENWEYGIQLPLENLIIDAPDILLTAKPYSGFSEAESLLKHPIFDHLTHLQTLELATIGWDCGVPEVLEGYEKLVQMRKTS